jgi:protein-tyrosine phosphatase
LPRVGIVRTVRPTPPLSIPGLLNVRDLGGLATADGRQVASGRLLRSDNLVGLNDEGVQAVLGEVGIKLIIDLRTAEECRREGGPPEALRGVRYVNRPLEPQGAVNEEQAAAGKATNLLDDYLAHLRLSGHVLIRAYSELVAAESLPAVVHCTAGKDRTGIFVALLLDLLGVRRDEIVADYAATAPNMAAILDRIRESSFFREIGLAAAPAWIFEANPDTMRTFLEIVDREHGGAVAWATAHGMREDLIAELRTRLLHDAADSPGADEAHG